MSERLRLPRGLPDEAYDLGDPTDEFSLGAGGTALKLTLGVVCLLGGILLAAVTVWLVVGLEPGPNAGGVRGIVYMGAFAVGLIVAGIALPIKVMRQSGMRVIACPGGLVYTHGEDAEVIAWDDVEELRYEVMQPGYNSMGGGFPRYRLTRRSDGREFTFDNFLPRLGALGRIVERKTLKDLLRDEQEAFDDGEVIRFGPLAVSRKGIRKGDEWLRWDEVKDVNFDRSKGQIVITKADKWLAWQRQLVNEVPNYHVFLEIVAEEMRR